jgi:hypothetical protein
MSAMLVEDGVVEKQQRAIATDVVLSAKKVRRRIKNAIAFPLLKLFECSASTTRNAIACECIRLLCGGGGGS